MDFKQVSHFMGVVARWTSVVAPRMLAFSMFLSGARLLFAGATPTSHERLQLQQWLVPLSVVEVPGFLASVGGLYLLILARGLQRRIDSAFSMAALTLTAAMAFPLLKGFDVEEALLLAVMLAVLVACRRHFYRKGALFTERFTLQWALAIAVVAGCSVWLILFAYDHSEYSHELWWHFVFNQNTPRSLRYVTGIVVIIFVFVFAGLLRAKPRRPAMPTREDLQTARAIVTGSADASANLALLGDKHLLFNKDRTALIMYGVKGRSWVSLGGPVGDREAARKLAVDFCELCDAGGRWPVFYKIDEDRLSMCVEMGLSLVKLGEEARVRLADFTLDGRARRHLRVTNHHLLESGCTFDVVGPNIDDQLLAELKEISDAWMAEKKTAEKGFSLGFFEPDYIRRGPVALVHRQGRTIAFSNVTGGVGKQELSGELMRYLPGVPSGVMDFLFIQLMLWGKQNGYEWFNLGMSPLSGIDDWRLAPLWNRFALLLYHHGDRFYGFQGLREYKEKFHPVWQPKYLASPGGIAFPIILANVATLISGGLTRLVKL